MQKLSLKGLPQRQGSGGPGPEVIQILRLPFFERLPGSSTPPRKKKMYCQTQVGGFPFWLVQVSVLGLSQKGLLLRLSLFGVDSKVPKDVILILSAESFSQTGSGVGSGPGFRKGFRVGGHVFLLGTFEGHHFAGGLAISAQLVSRCPLNQGRS